MWIKRGENAMNHNYITVSQINQFIKMLFDNNIQSLVKQIDNNYFMHKKIGLDIKSKPK